MKSDREITMFDDLKQLAPPLLSLPPAVANHGAVSIASLIFCCLPNLVRLSLAQPQHQRLHAPPQPDYTFAALPKLQVLNVAHADGTDANMGAMFRSVPQLRVLIATAACALPLDALPPSVEELDMTYVEFESGLDADELRRALPRLRRLVFDHDQLYVPAQQAAGESVIPGVECVCLSAPFISVPPDLLLTLMRVMSLVFNNVTKP